MLRPPRLVLERPPTGTALLVGLLGFTVVIIPGELADLLLGSASLAVTTMVAFGLLVPAPFVLGILLSTRFAQIRGVVPVVACFAIGMGLGIAPPEPWRSLTPAISGRWTAVAYRALSAILLSGFVALFGFVTAMVGVATPRLFLRVMSGDRGRCIWCGYDRAGIAPGSACPECGRTRPEPRASGAVAKLATRVHRVRRPVFATVALLYLAITGVQWLRSGELRTERRLARFGEVVEETQFVHVPGLNAYGGYFARAALVPLPDSPGMAVAFLLPSGELAGPPAHLQVVFMDTLARSDIAWADPTIACDLTSSQLARIEQSGFPASLLDAFSAAIAAGTTIPTQQKRLPMGGVVTHPTTRPDRPVDPTPHLGS